MGPEKRTQSILKNGLLSFFRMDYLFLSEIVPVNLFVNCQSAVIMASLCPVYKIQRVEYMQQYGFSAVQFLAF